VKVSGGRRDWRRDSSRAGGIAFVAALIALLVGEIDQPQPSLAMTPAQLIFAAQAAGTTSPAQSVTLTNGGTTMVEVAGLILSNPTGFGVTGTDCPQGRVPPGGRCMVSVAFHPAATGDFVGTLRQSETGRRVGLTGTGTTGIVDAPTTPPVQTPDTAPPSRPGKPSTPPTGPSAPTPPSTAPPKETPRTPLVRANFNLASYDTNALVGDTKGIDVVLTNTGETTIGPVQLRVEQATSAFALQSQDCVLREPLSTCTIKVNFTPSQEGSFTANLVAERGRGPLARTALTGGAMAKAPHAVLSQSRIEFTKTGDQVTLVVQNIGSAPLRIDGVAIDNTKDFEVLRAEACTKPGLVEPQKACAMFVRFKGRARTSGQLTVRHNDPPLSSSVELAALTAPQTLEVPRLKGKKRDDALRDITRARFTVGNVLETPQCKSFGEVLEQKPEGRAQALEGSPVDIWIASAGPNPAIVPDVRRQSQAVAATQIRDARLQVRLGPTEETDSVPRGSIASIEPRPQTRLAPDCPVTLRVAVPVPRIQVPDYVKRTLADVKQALKGAAGSFRLGSVTTSDKRPVPPGNDQFWIVIAQNPVAGTMVPRPSAFPLATRIDLTVSPSKRIE